MLMSLGVGAYEVAASLGDILFTSTEIAAYFTWEQASLLCGSERKLCIQMMV